jgi:hypothetical protein
MYSPATSIVCNKDDTCLSEPPVVRYLPCVHFVRIISRYLPCKSRKQNQIRVSSKIENEHQENATYDVLKIRHIKEDDMAPNQ